jgi:hypothetical protein
MHMKIWCHCHRHLHACNDGQATYACAALAGGVQNRSIPNCSDREKTWERGVVGGKCVLEGQREVGDVLLFFQGADNLVYFEALPRVMHLI